VLKQTSAASFPHLDSSTIGLTELVEELLLEDDDSLLLLLVDDEVDSSLLVEVTSDSLLFEEALLVLEGGTLHAPKTNNDNKGNKRNAFFIYLISPC